jgi:hypothetical protein
MARFTQSGSGDGSGIPGPQGAAGADGVDGLDSLFLGTWNSVTEFLAAYQGGPVGLADGDWWAFVKDNSNPNKIYVVREDPLSATGWVIDDNESFVLPQGTAGADGADGSNGADGADALWNYLGEYNGGLIYTAGDIVTYNGELWYRNVYTSAGYTPGGPEGYWDLLAAKGSDGADGADGNDGAPGAQGDPGSPGLVYLGNYVLGNGYIANLAVVKGSDNNLYIATSSGGLGDPVGNSAEWSIFLPKGVDGAQGETGTQGEPGVSGTTAVLAHQVKAGEALTKGQAVYVSSADGTNMIVSKASNTMEITSSKTMGLITTDLAHNGQGTLITEGLLAGLNTNGASAGDPVWLGTNGNLIYGLLNKPSAPAHLVFIGIVTRANANNGEIFVKCQNGFEVRELHDAVVEANGSLTDNEVFAYDSASGMWKNQTAEEAGLAPTTSGSWTVTTGTNTYNFTLPSSGTYTMWVNGNIPNGIIVWNATVTVTNANVPAIGSQYAWNYTSGGSPILLTAIPNQIRGVAGTINTDATYTGNSSNRFDFTIANTSGSSRTVYYGYTKI